MHNISLYSQNMFVFCVFQKLILSTSILNRFTKFLMLFLDYILNNSLLQAIRSNIFKNMLGSDRYMAPPNDTIALPELTYEELECLLEFLYGGHLTKEKVEKHVYSLSIAADKYEIPFLAKFCENQMLKSLNSNNALEVLEISDTCSDQSLKETVLNFIVKNMGDIVFSAKFDAFALKNPHLSVEITRASFIDGHSKRNNI